MHVLFTSHESLMAWCAFDLSCTGEADRLRSLCQVQRHVLQQPWLCAFESCICNWVAQKTLKGCGHWVHLLQHTHIQHGIALDTAVQSVEYANQAIPGVPHRWNAQT